MAEAILVMTILGVIASVMITTLKPAEFKEKALKLLAKKTIYQIDSATMQIISNNSADGTMENLFLTSDTDKFSFNDDFSKTLLLYQKYLATTRKEFDIDNTTDFFKQIIQSSSNANSQASPIYLKDGSLIFLGAGEKYGVSPDATGTINVEGCEMTKALYGLIAIDTNGDDEPNTLYQDQFYLPIGKTGVDWEQVCNLQSTDVVATTPTTTPTPSETEEEFNCDVGYALKRQYDYCFTSNTPDFTPEFCASLSGEWEYKPWSINGKYYYTYEEFLANSETGYASSPLCYNAECNIYIGTSVVCDAEE